MALSKICFKLLSTTLMFASFCKLSAQAVSYDVSSIDVVIKSELSLEEGIDPLDSVNTAIYKLSRSEDGQIMPKSAGGEKLEFSLSDSPEGTYSGLAIKDLQNQIVRAMGKADYFGIVVVPTPTQIDPRSGQDLRGGETGLTLDIWLNEVENVRTIAKGSRIGSRAPINNKIHDWILKESPIQVDAESEESTLIDKGAFNNYLQRLNEHPGRRADAALSSGSEPGKIIVDYLLNENKPWVVYAQVSNTGTESTGEWRQRLGGAYYQLTGNDDILTVDYLTSSFDQANAVAASYEFPLFKPNYLNVSAFGSYSDFDADNLVIEEADNFTGTTTIFGGEVTYTPFYLWGHALSVSAGATVEEIEVENVLGNSTGTANLLVPYVQFDATKSNITHRSSLSVGYRQNTDTGNDTIALTSLGRLGAVDDYGLVYFNASQSFFVEPLFPGYSRPNPDNYLANSLVHELAFSVRGQMTIDDNRLIPQKQLFGGGFFSVRGYEESAARGDSGFIGSAEYRFHLARLLKPSSLIEESDGPDAEPTTPRASWIRWRPSGLYGLPEWNLLLRGFVDYATFSINDIRPDEVEQDLLGVGVGVELQVKSYLNVRFDYGVAIEDLLLADGEVDPDQDSGRFHLIATLSY